MKKKVLTEEALGAMFSEGQTENQAEQETLTDNTEAKGTEQEIEAEAKDEKKDEKKDDCEDQMKDVLSDLYSAQAELTTAKTSMGEIEVKLAEKDAEVATLSADLMLMRDIVVEQVGRMRLALRLVSVDMSAFDSKTVIREYEAMKETMIKSFKAGPIVPTSTGEVKNVEMKSGLDAAKENALGFK